MFKEINSDAYVNYMKLKRQLNTPAKLLLLITLMVFVWLSFSTQYDSIAMLDDTSRLSIVEIQEPCDDADSSFSFNPSLIALISNDVLTLEQQTIGILPLFKPTTPALTFLVHIRPRSPPALA